MKVKCIKKYFDKELNHLVNVTDAPFEVSNERGAILLDAGVVKVAQIEEKPEEEPKTAPKKTRKKKGE